MYAMLLYIDYTHLQYVIVCYTIIFVFYIHTKKPLSHYMSHEFILSRQ